MKFRVEGKDLAIFGVFCLILLYISCVLVLNISTLSATGEFYGLWPFKAFSGEYIAATLIIFIGLLAAVFTAVNSYIFDRESGFGFTIGGKKSDGYSRWAKKNEVKKQLVKVDPKAYKADAAGLVVINDGKEMWVDNGEAHNIIIGATGSGKTQAVVFPMVQSLAKKGESMIITDPKGEIYEETSNMLRQRGYNIVILNFRLPQKGNSWNPMGLPYKLYKEGNSDKAIELLDDLAQNILYDEKSSGDPYWEKAAADYFTGLSLGLFDDAKEEQININSINLMASLGEERFGGPNNNYMKEYFNAKDPSRPAYVNASGVVYTAEDTKQGVISTFKQKVKIFSSRDNLSEMLSYSDFDMKDIGRQKTVVYMIVQDEKKTLHPLATIFIKQCYETLIDVAQESGGKLPYRTNFILDEFANMPPLKDVTTMVTAARSRLIRFTFIIQNYAQLTQVYGKENAETIKGNCNITYLISSELQALEELSKLCGEKKSKEKDKTSSTPLVTVSDLQRLQQYETISLRLRTMPFKTKLVPNWKMDWGRKFEKATYPERQKREIQLFDIREFVKEQKKKKMNDMMNESSNNIQGGNPLFGGGNPLFGGNPMLSGNPLFGGSSPFGDSPVKREEMQSQFASNDSNDDFNVDELVKRIDAKIAELEEEERREKEAEEKAKQAEKDKNIIEAEATVKEESTENIPIELENQEITSAKLSDLSQTDTKPVYQDDTDANTFFDDFFADE